MSFSQVLILNDVQWEAPKDDPRDALLALANDLLLPDDGNVEFRAKTKAGDSKSIYANRKVLSARCNYFKTSIFQKSSRVDIK